MQLCNVFGFVDISFILVPFNRMSKNEFRMLIRQWNNLLQSCSVGQLLGWISG